MPKVNIQYNGIKSIRKLKGRNFFDNNDYIKYLRKQMIIFAGSKLYSYSDVEDVVQESLLGAFYNSQSFNGESNFKTWVFSILKNKIVDRIRQSSRLIPISNLTYIEKSEDFLDSYFTQNGYWKLGSSPIQWRDPEKLLENNTFHKVYKSGINRLPEQYRDVYTMRELYNMSPKEISKSMGITTNYVYVVLHRSRIILREYLEDCWF